jgi:hypothetical protein
MHIASKIRLPVAAAALACFVAGAAAAQTPPTFQSGEWIGYARFDPKQNNFFTRCTLHARAAAPVRMALGLTRNRMLEIWLDGAQWTLDEGASYPVTYFVDADQPRDGTARAISKNLARIDVSDSRAMFDAIRRGAQLTVKTANDTMSFPLKGTAQALDRLNQCVEDNAPLPRAQAQGNPFGPPLPPAPTISDTAAFAQWSSNTGRITSGLIAVAERLNEVDRASDRMLEASSEDARAIFSEGQATIARFRRDLAALSQQADQLQPLAARDPGWRTRSVNLIRYTQSLRDQVAGMADVAEQTLQASLRQDPAVRRRLTMRTVDQAVTLLRSEIVMIELSFGEETHPQHALNLAIIDGNEALIATLGYIRDLLDGTMMPDTGRRATAERAIADLDRQVVLGGRKTDAAQMALRADRVTPPDKVVMLEHLLGTYRESFAVERRIARGLESMMETVFAITPERATSADSLKDVMDRLADALRELVNERMALIRDRTDTIAKLR